jgi:hypothetical protein
VVVAIHRVIEQQAATRGDTPAYVDDTQTLTYRELNGRANALARALITSGFKRSSVAAVRMAPSSDLVITLLAVLKAGGAYMWTDADDASWPRGLSIVPNGTEAQARCLAIDLTRMLNEDLRPGANLPILTRPTDVACVLRDHDGSPAVLVPHSTVTALRQRQVPRAVQWKGESGGLDLWLALMSGATVRVPPVAAPLHTFAA